MKWIHARAAWLFGLSQIVASANAQPFFGVNLAGGEFGAQRMATSNVYGKDYVFPGQREIAAFQDMGMTVFRLPVRWERVQPILARPLDRAEMQRIDEVIRLAGIKGTKVIIDIHNYGRYRGQRIGSPLVSTEHFNALWSLLARRYGNNPDVVFGLMNEPFNIPAGEWADIAQSAVRAIRKSGAGNLILVPGAAWTGAHSWRKPVLGGESNADALHDLQDPQDNFAFEFHQYFDQYSSGSGTSCVTKEVVEKRLRVATSWLEETGKRGFLAEFGASDSPECLAAMQHALEHLRLSDRWIGWTYWASSKWFNNYPFDVYPLRSRVPPQLAVLQAFIRGETGAAPTGTVTVDR